MPLRNIFRAKRRTFYTVLGIAFAMVLSVATVAMFDSIDYIMDKAFTDIERWDIMAAFDAPFGTARVAEIRDMTGVKRVQVAFMLPVTMSAGGVEEDVVADRDEPRRRLPRLRSGEWRIAVRRARRGRSGALVVNGR